MIGPGRRAQIGPEFPAAEVPFPDLAKDRTRLRNRDQHILPLPWQIEEKGRGAFNQAFSLRHPRFARKHFDVMHGV
jgi:hypothetical protein